MSDMVVGAAAAAAAAREWAKMPAATEINNYLSSTQDPAATPGVTQAASSLALTNDNGPDMHGIIDDHHDDDRPSSIMMGLSAR